MQRHMQSFVGVAISKSLGCTFFSQFFFFKPLAMPGRDVSENVLYLSCLFHLHISAVRNIISKFIHALNVEFSQHLSVSFRLLKEVSIKCCNAIVRLNRWRGKDSCNN